MIKRLLLHIGAEKTGTSALQTWWVQHRQALAEKGLLYPSSDTDSLAAHGRQTAGNAASLARALNDQQISDQDSIRAARRILERVIDEFHSYQASNKAIDSVLLSSEWLADSPPERLQAFAALCAEFAEETQCIYVMRHVADHAIAAYSDHIWRGGENMSLDQFIPRYSCRFQQVLTAYAAVFSKAAIHGFVYDDHRGSLAADIMAAMGYDCHDLPIAPRVNRSLSRSELEIIRELHDMAEDKAFVTRLAGEHVYQTREADTGPMAITAVELERLEARYMRILRQVNEEFLTGVSKLNSCSDDLIITDHSEQYNWTDKEIMLVKMLEACVRAHDQMTQPAAF